MTLWVRSNRNPVSAPCLLCSPKATKLLRRNALHVASYVSGQPKYDADDRIG